MGTWATGTVERQGALIHDYTFVGQPVGRRSASAILQNQRVGPGKRNRAVICDRKRRHTRPAGLVDRPDNYDSLYKHADRLLYRDRRSSLPVCLLGEQIVVPRFPCGVSTACRAIAG